MNLALAGLSYGITIVALALLTVRTTKLIGIYKKGQPDSTRGDNKAQRFRMAFREIFGHTKMLNFTVTGIAHWFVMIGFVSLLGTLITAYGQIIDPAFVIPFIGTWTPYRYFVLAVAWTTAVGIVALTGIRLATKFFHKSRTSRFLGSRSLKAYYVEATILAVVVCVITLDYLEHQYYVDGAAVQIVDLWHQRPHLKISPMSP